MKFDRNLSKIINSFIRGGFINHPAKLAPSQLWLWEPIWLSIVCWFCFMGFCLWGFYYIMEIHRNLAAIIN